MHHDGSAVVGFLKRCNTVDDGEHRVHVEGDALGLPVDHLELTHPVRLARLDEGGVVKGEALVVYFELTLESVTL